MSKEISNITRRSCLSLLLVLAASQAMSAQQSAPAGATTPAAAAGSSVGAASDGARASQPASQYRIGPRDGLAIRVTAPDIVAQFSSASNAQGEDAYAPQFLLLNLSDTLKGDEKSNPYLQPGDVITLPEAKEAYVIGNVLRPGPVMLKDDHLTVTRAVAMAGGFMPDTKMDKLRVIRVDADGSNRQEIPVDWTAIDKHKAEDIALRPNDIVEVPVSGGKRLLRSIISGGASSAAQLPIRVIPCAARE